MKIYSFLPQAQSPVNRIDNAAPVAHNPFAVLTTDIPRLQVLDRDAFHGSNQGAIQQFEKHSNERKPVVASFVSSLDWIARHNAEQLRSRLDTHLASGSFDDLSQASGLLNAANKTGRLHFGATEAARFDFNRHYGDAVDALRQEDPYAARLSLQRAIRCITGFRAE